MRLNLSFLLVLFSVVIGYGQFQSDEEYLKSLDAYPNSFRQQIDLALADYSTIQLEMITTPNNISSNFYLRQLLRIVKDHPNNIDFIITYGMIKESNGNFVFQSRKDEADIYRWMAVKNLYPDDFIKFLDVWATQYSSVYVNINDLLLVYDIMGYNQNEIENEADRLKSTNAILNNSATLNRVDAPIVRVNGQELVRPYFTADPFVKNCCDFNACLKSNFNLYPDDPLEEVKWWKDHLPCVACATSGNPAACDACAEQLGEDAADYFIAVEKCGNDPCKGDEVVCPNTSENIETFCNQYTTLYGLGPFSFDVIVVECLECPTITAELDGIYIHLPKANDNSLENDGSLGYIQIIEYVDPETGLNVEDPTTISLGGKVDLSGIPEGTQVTVTIDKFDCGPSPAVYVIPKGCIFDEFSAIAFNTETCGNCNGQIEVELSGGSEEYEISVSDSDGNPGPEINSSFRFENLCEGMYTVVAKDIEKGCQSSITVFVKSWDNPKYTVDVVGTCPDGNTGKIKLMSDGTNAKFSGNTTPIMRDKFGKILPANPNTGISNTGSLTMTGLSSGEYLLKISDDDCTEFKIIDVPVRTDGGDELKIELLYNNDNCGANTGEVMVKVTGGYPPYKISTRVGGQNGNVGDNVVEGWYLGNLINGHHKVSVIDACGHAAGPVEFDVYPVGINFNYNIEHSSIDCDDNDRAEGSISLINPTAGPEGHSNLPLSYVWSNGGESNSISNLVKGDYFCHITDAIGLCSEDFTAEIEAPKDEDCDCEINVTHFQNPFECYGDSPQCIGEISIDLPQGATVNWTGDIGNNSSSASELTGLCPGNITVEMTVGNCTTTQTFKIECCSTFSDGTLTEITPVHILGAADSPNRSISISVTGGSSTKIYSWSGPNGFTSSEKNISGLEFGQYCLTVNDGCTQDYKCFTIRDCDLLPVLIKGVQVTPTCEGLSFGSIDLLLQYSADVSFLWSNGATTQNVSNLAAGNYTLSIYDGAGCPPYTFNFNVGTHPQDVTASSNPCGNQFSCNGIKTTFTPSPVNCSVHNCRTETCTCSLTGTVISEVTLPLVGQFNVRCARVGFCPDGSPGLRLVMPGFETWGEPRFVRIPGCDCIICVKPWLCKIPGQGTMIISWHAAGDECGDPNEVTGGDHNFTTSANDGSMRISELHNALKNDAIYGESISDTLLLPEGMSDTLFLDEYLIQINEMINNEEDIILVPILPEIDESACTRICNSEIPPPPARMQKSNSQNFVDISPNPFSKEIVIGLNKFDNTSKYSLEISNYLGQIINNYKIDKNHLTIKTESYASGLYLLVIRKDDIIIYQQKIVKQ